MEKEYKVIEMHMYIYIYINVIIYMSVYVCIGTHACKFGFMHIWILVLS